MIAESSVFMASMIVVRAGTSPYVEDWALTREAWADQHFHLMPRPDPVNHWRKLV
jgi:hypothetical protein